MLVNRSSHQLLTNTGFPDYQDGFLGSGRPRNLLVDLDHRGRESDHTSELLQILAVWPVRLHGREMALRSFDRRK